MSVTASPLLEVQSSRSPQGEKQVVRQIPSLRNREVYVAVAAGKSHAEAGQEFGLTQQVLYTLVISEIIVLEELMVQPRLLPPLLVVVLPPLS